MSAVYDAVVIGAGHNGLVAALYLAKAGWKTLVLERNEQVGGAVMSGEVTLPGFIHDLYSTNQNLFLASPVYQELRADLERHGLRYCTSSTPYSNVFPDGSNVQVYQHPDLFQNFIYRPFPGWFTYRMPIEGLYMVGAATWPGAGTSAISGYLTAHKLLRPSAWRNRLIGGGGIAGAATVAGIGAARWLQRNTV